MIFFENFYRFKKKLFNKTELQISNDINFGSKKANEYFIKKLKKSKFYFEFGSGSSTLLADSLKKKFVSIELDKSFFNLMKKKLKNKDIYYINIGPVGEFSYPLVAKKKNILSYISSINKYFKKKNYPDFVLIDGRFRVACCLNLFLLIKKKRKKITILIDDYKKRDYYKILKNFFYIKNVGRMALLNAKDISIDSKLIKKYILDPR